MGDGEDLKWRIGGRNEHRTLVGAGEALVITAGRNVAVGGLGTGKEGGTVGCGWKGFVANDGRHILGYTVDGVGGDIGGRINGVRAVEVGGKEEEENCFEINVGDVGEVDAGEN